jgi:ABC-type sulfate/molybdate transport systems ATPase subunit
MDLLEIDIALPRRTFELRAALTLGPAETLALIGPSGAGKSSLIRAVAGLERPRAGRIALGGSCWLDTERGIDLTAERRHVGYLPQDYGLFPHLDVAGNVRFAGGRDRPDLLERVGLSHLARARPHQLSGGERQRAALARALARDPRVLLLDEPFGALDAITRTQVRDQLADMLSTLRLPALVVTHSIDDATALADRIVVIDRGRLLQVATTSELLRNPATPTVASLTGANVVGGTATPGPAGSIVRLDGGGELLSSATASGRVSIAVQPWELELADPASSTLIDTVVSVRADHGGLIVRLTRFTIRAVPAPDDGPTLTEGQPVGLRAAPSDVRVLAFDQAT